MLVVQDFAEGSEYRNRKTIMQQSKIVVLAIAAGTIDTSQSEHQKMEVLG